MNRKWTSRRKQWRLLLAAMMVLFLGIGPGVANAGEEEQPMSAVEWPDVSGEWRLDVVSVAQSRIPVVGEVQTTTRSVLKVRLEQRGSQVELVGTTESIQVESSTSMVRTIIPERFVRSVKEVRRRGELRRSGDGYELFFPRHWEVQGARLSDPAREALPQEPGDRRVYDQDGDGNPGVTVRVEGVVSGSLYVVQRGWDEWRFTIPGDGEFEEARGTLVWDMEQVILGATSRFLRKQPETRPDRSRSYVQIRRLSAVQGVRTGEGRMAS